MGAKHKTNTMLGQYHKWTGVALSAVALLFVIIGLSVKGCYTYEKGNVKAWYGIKESTMEAGGKETTTDIWDDHKTDNQKKWADSYKAAFAMCFLGLLANVVQIIAFLVELIGQPKSLGKIIAMATGGAMFLFYMIGFSLMVDGPKAAFEDSKIDGD